MEFSSDMIDYWLMPFGNLTVCHVPQAELWSFLASLTLFFSSGRKFMEPNAARAQKNTGNIPAISRKPKDALNGHVILLHPKALPLSNRYPVDDRK